MCLDCGVKVQLPGGKSLRKVDKMQTPSLSFHASVAPKFLEVFLFYSFMEKLNTACQLVVFQL